MTSTPSPAPAAQQQEAAHTSRLSAGGEKAVIASTSIGGFLILMALAWFLWRSFRRKSAGRKSVWPANLPSRDVLESPRRVSSKVSDKFTSIKGRLLPGTLGWCNIGGPSNDDVPESEKPVPTAAAAAKSTGTLLERRLGAGTPPQRVKVNAYGMVFRTPINGDSMSDLMGPPPPSSAAVKQPVSLSKQMVAAAHLESARASMSVSAHNTTLRTLPPPHVHSRISDVSSLSSGFGDGDIVIIQPPAAFIAANPTQPDTVDPSINLEAVRNSPERKSSSSRLSRNRDTVYTDASEDLRPRFRTVSSWVRQQSRRMRRAAASKSEDGVPAVPDLLLPEQGFDMMMPDGEEPRRVESAMWRQKTRRSVMRDSYAGAMEGGKERAFST
ncbi:hypothetical protein Trco_008364 [Trichoderma cornu-damae]|uniref:Uncharacterized protein n=1 Tax=Trichoderma cornu-damae TaxID=654480 RepID=A0A9P8TSR5_9HYPO|nr:hypothetical protein Trco_008364 [Trichoderma cornu-damae]